MARQKFSSRASGTEDLENPAIAAIVEADFSAAAGEMLKTSAGVYTLIKVNFAATADPVAGDDNLDGYAVGSRWINVTTDVAFICLDATTAAAVWRPQTLEDGDVPLDLYVNLADPSSPDAGDVWALDEPVTVWKYRDSSGNNQTLARMNKIVTAKTADYTITKEESGHVFTNAAATATVVFTLPTAVAGHRFTFIVSADTYQISVKPAASDRAYLGNSITTASTGVVHANAVGEAITFVAIDATNWVATTDTGTWTVT